MSKEDNTNKSSNDQSEEILEDQNEMKDGNQDETVSETEDDSIKQQTPEEIAEEESFQQKYLRLMADFQNYKKRVEKEKSDIFAFANEKIIVDILNVLDNFERAISQGSEDSKFLEGMDMVFKQQLQVLTNAGVEEIKSDGEEFDPNIHNAIMMEEEGDMESGKITETLQKGYSLKGKVLRPSMVKVKK